MKINGSYILKHHPKGPSEDFIEIDFTPPFKRVHMIEALELKLGEKLP